MTKSLLLDANVLVNICKKAENHQSLIQEIANFDFIYIAGFSLFMAELKCIQDCKTPKDKLIYQKELNKLKNLSEVVYFDENILEQAKQILTNRDYEDACQTACALQYKCSSILTSDLDFAQRYGGIIKMIYIDKKGIRS